jgi:hypothetical protein
VPTPVGSALSKARQCTPRMVASFFCCSWAQCEFVHGLMPPSLKHLIGFRRDRREAIFLFAQIVLQCMSLLLAQSGHSRHRNILSAFGQ